MYHPKQQFHRTSSKSQIAKQFNGPSKCIIPYKRFTHHPNVSYQTTSWQTIQMYNSKQQFHRTSSKSQIAKQFNEPSKCIIPNMFRPSKCIILNYKQFHRPSKCIILSYTQFHRPSKYNKYNITKTKSHHFRDHPNTSSFPKGLYISHPTTLVLPNFILKGQNQ